MASTPLPVPISKCAAAFYVSRSRRRPEGIPAWCRDGRYRTRARPRSRCDAGGRNFAAVMRAMNDEPAGLDGLEASRLCVTQSVAPTDANDKVPAPGPAIGPISARIAASSGGSRKWISTSQPLAASDGDRGGLRVCGFAQGIGDVPCGRLVGLQASKSGGRCGRGHSGNFPRCSQAAIHKKRIPNQGIQATTLYTGFPPIIDRRANKDLHIFCARGDFIPDHIHIVMFRPCATNSSNSIHSVTPR